MKRKSFSTAFNLKICINIYTNLNMLLVCILVFFGSCEARKIFARVGDDVNISCEIYPAKSPVWTVTRQSFLGDVPTRTIFSGKAVTSTISYITWFDDGSYFILKSVKLDDMGRYTCKSNKGFGENDVTELSVFDGFQSCRENFQTSDDCIIKSAININFSLSCRDEKSRDFIQPTFRVNRKMLSETLVYELNIKLEYSQNFECDLEIFDVKNQIIHVERLKRLGNSNEKTKPTENSNEKTTSDPNQISFIDLPKISKYTSILVGSSIVVIIAILASIVVWKIFKNCHQPFPSQTETRIFL